MYFEQIDIGGDRNFAYLIADEQTKEAAIVDAGYSADLLAKRLTELGMTLKYIIATHAHYDHVDDFAALQKLAGGQVVAYKTASLPVSVDLAVDDGDVIQVGSVKLGVIFSPGHTDDDISLLVDDQHLITGDTLFVGKIGGTSGEQQSQMQYDSLHQKIMTLPDEVQIWPGHDVGTSPSSTIGQERKTNPFLLRDGFDDFLWLKNNWVQYKLEHGIQ